MAVVRRLQHEPVERVAHAGSELCRAVGLDVLEHARLVLDREVHRHRAGEGLVALQRAVVAGLHVGVFRRHDLRHVVAIVIRVAHRHAAAGHGSQCKPNQKE